MDRGELDRMTADEFALYARQIRLTNHPGALAVLRDELDRLHPSGKDSDALVAMATLKRVRLIESN